MYNRLYNEIEKCLDFRVKMCTSSLSLLFIKGGQSMKLDNIYMGRLIIFKI